MDLDVDMDGAADSEALPGTDVFSASDLLGGII